MANTNLVKVRLRMKFDGGLVDGKEKVIAKNYQAIQPTATNEGLHSAAIAMASLQDKALIGVVRLDETEITE